MRSHIHIYIIVALIVSLCIPGCTPVRTGGRNDLSAGVVTGEEDQMVFIPAGKFVMGSDIADPDETPMHEVQINAFYIDAHEVTVRQYKKFMDATGHKQPDFWIPWFDRPDDPIVGVSWYDAQSYATWAGKRLPFEAEWEYAARGGIIRGIYSWGDSPDLSYANYNSFGIAPVKSFKPNGYGIYDMSGNVWEWCADWYDQTYYSAGVMNNPQGPAVGTHKVLRGGAWYCNEKEVRAANRFFALPDAESFNVGFRCAKSAQ